jgi:hypothetical protein
MKTVPNERLLQARFDCRQTSIFGRGHEQELQEARKADLVPKSPAESASQDQKTPGADDLCFGLAAQL